MIQQELRQGHARPQVVGARGPLPVLLPGMAGDCLRRVKSVGGKQIRLRAENVLRQAEDGAAVAPDTLFTALGEELAARRQLLGRRDGERDVGGGGSSLKYGCVLVDAHLQRRGNAEADAAEFVIIVQNSTLLRLEKRPRPQGRGHLLVVRN